MVSADLPYTILDNKHFTGLLRGLIAGRPYKIPGEGWLRKQVHAEGRNVRESINEELNVRVPQLYRPTCF